MQVNSMRFEGLASGMDTQSIVDKLMEAERLPLTRLLEKKQVFEWQRDEYRDVNSMVKDFDDLIFDGVFRQSTFLQKNMSSSNESAVSAKAISASGNVSTKIEVSQLASAETWVSSQLGSDYTGGDHELTFQVTNPGESEATEVNITIEDTDTLDDVIKKLNSSGLGVTAFRDDFGDRNHIVMTMNETGADAKIELANEETVAFMTTQLGFNQNSDDPTILQSENTGNNAIFKINDYETERASNNFQINGVEYALKNITTSPVTITTATDTDAILETVVTFVEEYNQMIENMNGKLTEQTHRDYKPLSDEERAEMSEKQIELWEEKAKSGLLRNDSIISGGLNQMRMDLYSPVELEDGSKIYLGDIGISTSSDYLDRGKLTIDLDKLREVITDDPNKVSELFRGNSDSDDYEKMGLANRLRDTSKSITVDIEAKAGNDLRTNQQFMIGRNLIDVDDQIVRFQDRLTRVEERYWKQFTAMEMAIQKANQQSMYLMQQFEQ